MENLTSGDGWAQSVGNDGLPVWVGKESIYNVIHDGANMYQSLGCLGIGGAVAIGFIALGGNLLGVGAIPHIAIFGGVGVWAWRKSKKTSKWLRDDWRLVASADGLAYSKAGAPVWAVSFDDAARVEIGQTVEWQPTRDYRAIPANKHLSGVHGSRSIPDVECQTFIFAADGRRLVVHTANAAREDCGQLAHSIRSYVEAQRGNAAPSSSDTSSPAADGFDL